MSIDENQEFIVETDASNVAISAIVNQNGIVHLIYELVVNISISKFRVNFFSRRKNVLYSLLIFMFVYFQ